MEPATLCAPPIPGLFFTPSILVPPELADQVTQFCLHTYFGRPGVNQIMLFGEDAMPPVLLSLLSTVSALLAPPVLVPSIHALLFPLPGTATRERQAILNLYHPGEGITPHVDLLGRFGDGIVGVSFGSSCVMRFAPACVGEDTEDCVPAQLFLPARSIIVLSGDARYAWTHGIDKRTTDLVADADVDEPWVVERGVRLSITFRWLLPGADVVGEDEDGEDGAKRPPLTVSTKIAQTFT
ncbi:hypothetical protein GGX14DRAFT_352147 [Mycena pura]|uniref:Fe2OG dioxygenase domain-containing protein n=1 Tax=Mycena pura TaxID=153505 RepID=A0AAD7E1D7_9AGAR|nr:hypothetical protein GGX14DRAFT_352147 [Mycena pura]